jgi:hypothetical protein
MMKHSKHALCFEYVNRLTIEDASVKKSLSTEYFWNVYIVSCEACHPSNCETF